MESSIVSRFDIFFVMSIKYDVHIIMNTALLIIIMQSAIRQGIKEYK